MLKHGIHLALTSGNFFLANASVLEYENFFMFSASYRSTSKEYRLVSARWKPGFSEIVKLFLVNNLDIYYYPL